MEAPSHELLVGSGWKKIELLQPKGHGLEGDGEVVGHRQEVRRREMVRPITEMLAVAPPHSLGWQEELLGRRLAEPFGGIRQRAEVSWEDVAELPVPQE